jgi:hypoxanthine phosphoribosyltransferase
MTEADPAVSSIAHTLVSEPALRDRVGDLGAQIARAYASAARPPLLVSVLKGSSFFLADLIRTMSIDVNVDFMSISSYGSPGVVRIVKDLESDVTARDVLIVEDIVDTGFTLNYLRKTLLQRQPASLKAVTLLDKAARRIVPVQVEFTGFEIPDVFVVGYGLDFQGRYRNCRSILAVRDVARLANDPLVLVDHLFGKAR